jgi:hypothetical protein
MREEPGPLPGRYQPREQRLPGRREPRLRGRVRARREDEGEEATDDQVKYSAEVT